MADSSPTLTEYFDAAFRASFDKPIDSDISPLLGSDGQPLVSTISQDGFSAEAFTTPGQQLIVAYAGTDFKALLDAGDPMADLALHQITDDVQIYNGDNPIAYADGVSFLHQAEIAAIAAGVSVAPGNVFVDGHSLGGAIAAYVAAQNDLPGTTFAAPGLAPGDIPSGADAAAVTAYVEYGDPIGNYGGKTNYEGSLLSNPDITRFGTPDYIGKELDRLELLASGYLYGKDKNAGLASFAAEAAAHHALTHYAADLGVSLPAGESNGPDITLQQIISAVKQAAADAASALTVSLAPDVTFTDPTTAVLTGTVSGSGKMPSVDITADVDGVHTDLGAAMVDSDGTFTFTDPVGSHFQSNITATATDTAGDIASQTARFALQDGMQLGLYGASPDPHKFGKTIELSAPGQTVVSDDFDVFANHHQKDTTFVFSPGFGIDAIRGFTASGPGHDLLVLPKSDFHNLAAVLRDTGDINGSAFITDPKTGDAIRIVGVTTAELKANRKDFALA